MIKNNIVWIFFAACILACVGIVKISRSMEYGSGEIYTEVVKIPLSNSQIKSLGYEINKSESEIIIEKTVTRKSKRYFSYTEQADTNSVKLRRVIRISDNRFDQYQHRAVSYIFPRQKWNGVNNILKK